MTKRRNKIGIGKLLRAPWQITTVLAFELFVVMRWVAPALLNSPVSAKFGDNLSSFAPAVATVLLVLAVFSYFLNHYSSSSLFQSDKQSIGQTTFKKEFRPTEWSIELLRTLEWYRFETLFAEYFRLLGKQVESVHHGTEGGIDTRIYSRDSQTLEFAVQCKAWNGIVGTKPIFELFGVMAHESAGKGIFVTTGSFSEEAKQFADEHKDKLFLIDGLRFIAMITKLPDEKKAKLLAFAIEGDYTTPTCASCGAKMVWQPKGSFWECHSYLNCKTILKVES